MRQQGLRDTFGLGTAPGHDYGLSGLNEAIEMSYQHQQQASIEDSQPLARSSEDRLAAAVGRISRNTYTAPREVLDFASPATEYGVSSLTSMTNCGAADQLGYCIERFHSADCGSYSGPDMITPQLRAQMSRITSHPVIDANGRTWNDQHGAAMTLPGLIEASTGQRATRENLFETGSARPELAEPTRQNRYGDFDGGQGEAFTASTRAAAARIAAADGHRAVHRTGAGHAAAGCRCAGQRHAKAPAAPGLLRCRIQPRPLPAVAPAGRARRAPPAQHGQPGRGAAVLRGAAVSGAQAQAQDQDIDNELADVFLTNATRTSTGPGPGPKRLPRAEAADLVQRRLAVYGTDPPRGFS